MVESRPAPLTGQGTASPGQATSLAGLGAPLLAGEAALRVLHLDTGRTWGGGQRQALLLAEALRERGHESACAFRAGAPLAAAAAAAGFELLPFSPRGEWDLAAALDLRKRLRAAPPDLVHAHDGHAVSMALLAARGIAPVVASRRVAFPLPRNPLARLKLRAVARWLAVSAAAREVLLRAGASPGRIDVVPSGVRVPRTEVLPPEVLPRTPRRPALRSRLGVRADSFVVLAAGRLEPVKGQRTFLEACALAGDLGNTRWVVAGEGPDRSFLERLAQMRGVAERVVFAGHLSELPPHMPEIQVCVLPSFSEALGNVLLEALAAGVPVVASDTGGIPEAITDGVEGLLVPVGDARSMAEAVRRLYLDAALRAEMGARARGRAQAFDMDTTAERTLAAYRAALSERRSPRAQEGARPADRNFAPRGDV
jgi:glycosyltransferase involved in cell wall biosynthesis